MCVCFVLFCFVLFCFFLFVLFFIVKGTDHDFCWSGKPIYHLQKQGNIHIFQNKYQNPHKFAEIMKKNRVLASFFLEGTLTVFLIS